MKVFDFLVEWIATILIIVGVYLTSWDYYPINLFISVAGNLGWLYIGIRWRKASLIVIQAVISGIYLVRFFEMWWMSSIQVH
jgi:hypothetical protein